MQRFASVKLIAITAVLSATLLGEHGIGLEERPMIYVKTLVGGAGVSASEVETVSAEIERAVISFGKYQVMSQSQIKELFKTAEFQ